MSTPARPLPRLILITLLPAMPLLSRGDVAWQRIDSTPLGLLPTPTSAAEPTCILAVDADADGDADLIVGGRQGAPALTLWRYHAGAWHPETIEPDSLRPEAGGAAHDLDADGDLDVVFGGDAGSSEVWWWENPHPRTGRWTRHLIKADGAPKHHDQLIGDFDGDGRPELLSWNQRASQLIRFTIPADPRHHGPWSSQTIYRYQGPPEQEGLAAADVDGDGVQDIVAAGRWFKHAGHGEFTAHPVDESMGFSRAAAGQLVAGDRPELVFVTGDIDSPLNYYTWDGDRWITHTLEPHMTHGHSLQVADLDGDGHLDVLAAVMGRWNKRDNHPTARVLAFYGDSRGHFRRQIISIGQGAHQTQVADLDGDGRLDVITKPFRHNTPRLVAWMNRGSYASPLPLDRWTRHRIDAPGDIKRLFVEAADLDGDGLPDIVSGDAWFRNAGCANGVWQKNPVGAGFMNHAIARDFDRDGDIDLLGTTAAFRGAQFVLAVNDGRGRFSTRADLPAGDGDFLQGIAAGRLLDDTNLVLLSWHKNSAGLEALRYPDNGATGAWERSFLHEFSENEQITLADLDRDHDVDVVLGTHWLRNDGPGWSRHPLGIVTDLSPEAMPDRVGTADLNRDGWLDIAVSLEKGTAILWFENPGATGPLTAPWPRHLVGQVPGQGFSMGLADFDADGNTDIVVGEHRNPDKVNRVVLFANADGRGGAWREHVIDQGPATEIDHHDGTIPVDIDGDGDIDILSIGFYNPSIWLLENRAITSPPREAKP